MITKDMETSQGQVTLRGLKRREIKELKARGIDFGGITAIEKLEEASEAVLRLVLPESFIEKFDDLEEAEIWRMWREVRALTYPSEEQATNLD
jgi:hypothetical protein